MGKQGFRNLLVWQRGKKLAVAIYKLTSLGKFTRDFGLTDQLRRCAVSVPSNIAEGDERDTDKEAARFFYIAKGSLAELATQLEIALEIGYLTTAETAPLLNECDELARMLGALIKARTL